MCEIRTFRVHGVNYIRTGSCKRCGECEKTTCPHLAQEGTLSCCLIHEKDRAAVCEECTNDKNSYFYRGGRPVTHQVCIVFPDHPFLRVIKEGICGYKFEPATEEDSVKHQLLVDTWQ